MFVAKTHYVVSKTIARWRLNENITTPSSGRKTNCMFYLFRICWQISSAGFGIGVQMEAIPSGFRSGGGRHRRLRQSGASRRRCGADGTHRPRRAVDQSERSFRLGFATPHPLQAELLHQDNRKFSFIGKMKLNLN